MTRHAPPPHRPAPTHPTSLEQDFLCEMDRGDATGSLGPKHIVTSGWLVQGPLDIDALRAALTDLVDRHESLRTAIPRGGGPRRQTVHPARPPELRVRDLPSDGGGEVLRERRAEEFLVEIEAGRYRADELPHLRAHVGRFDDEEAVLALVVHHIAADGWSMRVLVRDLAALYAARAGHGGAADLPPAPQYREYAAWQQSEWPAAPGLAAARGYWARTLHGAEFASLPTDRPMPDDAVDDYTMHRAVLGGEAPRAVAALAKEMRSSPFMVLLAAYTVLLHQESGATDITVPTFTAGRGSERFHDTVGPFLNFLPLRTDIAGCRNFREVVERVRTTCLEAFAHDIPFAEIEAGAPGLMKPFMDPERDVIAFEVLQFPDELEGRSIGGLRYREIRHRTLFQRSTSDIPDGLLWALDVLPTGELAESLKYNSLVLDDATVDALVDRYHRLLGRLAARPDAELPAARRNP